MKSKKGFTLIELLVVVLIIGILAAIAVPQYRKAVAKSRFAQLKLLINDIVKAQEIYYLANGKYTANFDDLDITMPNGERTTNYDSIGKVSVDKLIYDWGSCHISDSHAVCKDTGIDINLDYYYHNLTSKADKKNCTVGGTQDLSDYRNSLCKEESGAETGTPDSSYNVIFWTYK